MQISARFVNNWHYSVKLWNTLLKTLKTFLIFLYLQDGTFALAYIDLHWATSEHSVAGETTADLEMQLHHFDLSFDSYENAVKVPGATISLSLLFKVNHSGL